MATASTEPRSAARHADIKSTPFRTEIQALRAIAVLVVVIYHLWPHRLTGGFVGVDIFFVISGFLITRHLMKEVEATGRISLPQFWARRARRLLPASMLVLSVTAVSVIAFVPQMYWQTFLKQIGASALYAQNWVLAGDSIQYFAAENSASPVQHFWSLSVEEQFYLIWPLIIGLTLILSRRLSASGRRRAVLIVLSCVAVGSLAASVYLTAVSPGEAYFVTHVRAWEFAAGGILAIAGTAVNGRVRTRAVVSWLGWATIAATVVSFSPATQFPGYMAAIPVAGTLAVIWAGSPESRLAPGTYLGAAPIRALGNISYSVYLWHWPLIVLATITVDDFHWRAKAMMIPAILLLAWATTTLVENPVRTGRWLTSRRPRATFIAAAIAMILIAVPALILSADAAQRSAIEARRAATAASNSGPCFGAGTFNPDLDCAAVVYDKLTPSPAAAAEDLPEVYGNGCYSDLADPALHSCTVGVAGAAFRVALIGDSHAAHWYPAVKRLAEEHGWELTPFMKSACPQSAAPKSDKVAQVAEACAAWNTALAAKLAAAAPFNLVIVSHSATGDSYGSKSAAVDGFQKSWATLTARGAQVAVIRDVPKATEGTAACVAKHEDAPESCNLLTATSLEDEDLMVTAAKGQAGVTVVDMNNYFCTGASCAVVRGGVVVYRDSHHITATYSTTLAPYLMKKLAKAGAAG